MKKRWYEVAAFSDDGERVILVGERKAYIRGPIDNLLVLQVDDVDAEHADQIYQQAMTVLEMGGVTTPVVMMSSRVKLCRVVPVRNHSLIAALDARESEERARRAASISRAVEKDVPVE